MNSSPRIDSTFDGSLPQCKSIHTANFNVTHHKPLQKLPGTLQINIAYLHKISHHALLRGGHVLVELLSSVVELFFSFDVLTGDRKQFH